ncbi:MAG TPA: L-histidine N(alpha)-methyltransferase [Candidatus Acidoferrum sp.]|nr:L-histidine N(alpha)-methyltransferase [Candidatus Acidoferrum sp.]
MSGATVFIHKSQFPDAVRRELVRSLRARRINHKFHYESAKQAQRWLAVHEAHSPARTDQQCLRTYDVAFNSVSAQISTERIRVIGLGCGGGQKDVRLLELLARRGKKLAYAPCDVSVPLVLVARNNTLKIIDEAAIRPLVCDLALTKQFDALIPSEGGEQRLITFFGMIPNFEPRVILPKLAQIVRRGDWLLFSANLVPAPDEEASMRRILPQYDNELTREWLLTLLLDLGVERDDGAVQFMIETVPGRIAVKRFIARFHFHRSRSLQLDGEAFNFRRGEEIQLFFSYRYTPRTVEQLLKKYSLRLRDSWATDSGEEGIFLCRRG